ncbi:unnamed protein product [Choristocarpus tenellus]
MVPDYVDHGMPLLQPSPDPNINPYAGHTGLRKIQGTHKEVSLATERGGFRKVELPWYSRCNLSGVNMHGELPFSMKALMDPGSGITSISESLVKKMQQRFDGAALKKPLHQPYPIKIANGLSESIGNVTRPLNVVLHSGYGPIVVRTLVLALTPGNDDVLIVVSKTLRDVLGFDTKQSFEEATQRKTELHIAGLEQDITSMWRMSVSMEVMEESMGTAHLDRGDDSVSTLLEQGPDLMMDPAEEEKKRSLALETSLQEAQRSEMPLGAWGCLKQVIATRTMCSGYSWGVIRLSRWSLYRWC